MDELERIRRQNRRFFLILSFFVLLIITGLVLSYFHKEPAVVKNYVGKDGSNGQDGRDAQVDYSALYTLIDNRISVIPKPQDGRDGRDGQPGANGLNGTNGYTPIKGVDYADGKDGEAGPPGRSVEFQCDPQTHDYQWRYVGDDSWITLQANSKACTGND